MEAGLNTARKIAVRGFVGVVTAYAAFNLPSCGPTIIEDGNKNETGIVLNDGDFTVSPWGENKMRIVPNPSLYGSKPSDKWHTAEEIQAEVTDTMKAVERRARIDLTLSNCDPVTVENATDADIPGMPKKGVESSHKESDPPVVIWVATLAGNPKTHPLSLSVTCFDNLKAFANSQ